MNAGFVPVPQLKELSPKLCNICKELGLSKAAVKKFRKALGQPEECERSNVA